MKAKEQIKILDNFAQEIWGNVQELRKEVNGLNAVDGAHRLELTKIDREVASMDQYLNEALKNLSKTCDDLKRQCSIFDTARKQRVEELRIHGNRIYDLENSRNEIQKAFEALTTKTYNDVKKVKADTASAVSDLNARLNCLEASHKCHRSDIDKLRWQVQALEEDNKHLRERLYKSNHALNEIDKALKESGEFDTCPGQKPESENAE